MASVDSTTSVTLIHATGLLAEPHLDAPVIALLMEREQLQVGAVSNGFLLVRLDDGRSGFVPSALTGQFATPSPNDLPMTRVLQTVALYRSPVPGQQIVQSSETGTQPILVDPADQLWLLGRTDRFALVQLANGQIGYVPAVLCAEHVPVEQSWADGLGWIALGFGWTFANWGGVSVTLTQTGLVPEDVRPYVGLVVVLGAAFALFLGARRRSGRPFAIGVLLCYAALHLATGGGATLWG
jgi:hypothetical protein